MYVTDTHALVYYVAEKPSRLGKHARRIFQKAENHQALIYVPTTVLWEMSRRLAEGSITFSMPFDQWCRSLEAHAGFSVAALEWQDVDEARRFGFKDPFDCLIAGTAARLKMPLITKDTQISGSGRIETVW
jgi:PIN domain nuclease of toxin-antitoxin system